MIDVLRLLWSGEPVEYHGRFHDFAPLSIQPVPTDPIPIWIGGDSDIALRRAAARGDGWIGSVYDLDGALAQVGKVQALRKELGTDDRPFEILVAVKARPDDTRVVDALEAAGVTGLMCGPQQLERMA